MLFNTISHFLHYHFLFDLHIFDTRDLLKSYPCLDDTKSYFSLPLLFAGIFSSVSFNDGPSERIVLRFFLCN